mmetsp:Transcript_40330/g.95820  ORF Transcript_40330/g.95820 Transcript_40330/m.95820 type:complete len:230 (+) Transcript_40330:1544-2233(+)
MYPRYFTVNSSFFMAMDCETRMSSPIITSMACWVSLRIRCRSVSWSSSHSAKYVLISDSFRTSGRCVQLMKFSHSSSAARSCVSLSSFSARSVRSGSTRIFSSVKRLPSCSSHIRFSSARRRSSSSRSRRSRSRRSCSTNAASLSSSARRAASSAFFAALLPFLGGIVARQSQISWVERFTAVQVQTQKIFACRPFWQSGTCSTRISIHARRTPRDKQTRGLYSHGDRM